VRSGDFYDDATVERQYYREVERLVTVALDVSAILTFGWDV
jgi:hypothetical protein